MTNFNKRSVHTEQAIFGMGCFWGPDSLFGSIPAVSKTEVGFAGGTSERPTYRQIGDHTETVRITFDPQESSYEALVRLFWQHHDAAKDRAYKGRQYISLLLYQNGDQLQQALKVKAELEQKAGRLIETEFQPCRTFYPAENHHQKYNLRRFKKAAATLRELFPDEDSFQYSTIAARLNGFVREKGTLPGIRKEIRHWGLEPNELEQLGGTLERIRW